MADEILYSALGLEPSPLLTDCHDSSPNSTSLFSDYETPCATPSSDNSEFFENLENPSYCTREFQTESLYLSQEAWNDWIPTTSESAGTSSIQEYIKTSA